MEKYQTSFNLSEKSRTEISKLQGLIQVEKGISVTKGEVIEVAVDFC